MYVQFCLKIETPILSIEQKTNTCSDFHLDPINVNANHFEWVKNPRKNFKYRLILIFRGNWLK